MNEVKKGFLGAGDTYYRRFDPVLQEWGGLEYFGDIDKFELKENGDIKKQSSKGKSSYGNIFNTATLKGEPEFSMVSKSVDPKTMAMLFLGTTTVIDITGASATDEPHVAHLDTLIKTDFRNISSAAITGLIEGTDFSIENAQIGLIKILSGGTVTEGQALAVSYTYGDSSGTKVSGGTQPSIKVQLFLDGYELSSQKDYEVNVWEVQLTPTSPFDFLADEFSPVELTGTPLISSEHPVAYEVNLIGS